MLVGAAQATPQDSSQCILQKYAATSVTPLQEVEHVGYGTYDRLAGAQVYVAAREGLTAEWLALDMQRALSSGSAACRPAHGVKVNVVSAGAGFWVS